MISLKERLDSVLVKRGFFSSREKAKASVMAGLVTVGGQMAYKAGMQVDPGEEISIKEDACPYVGRGGLKLKKALDVFKIDLKGKTAIDMGASTGGFTDCMLKAGAAKVYAIDVGYGQLDWKLRNDKRVINIERTNIRYMDHDHISEEADFISIDVSFISVNLIFPKAAMFLKEDGNILCLVKPQFEAGRDQVGKKGIVRDKKVHKEVIKKVIGYGKDAGLFPAGLTYSPIKGAGGNIEYLLFMKKNDHEAVSENEETSINIEKTVGESNEII